MRMKKEEINAVCDILKYIQKQPQAKHTAQGIAKYWIVQQRLEEKIEVVASALEYLIQNGFLEEVKMEDGHSYFKVKEKRLKDIPSTIQTLEK